VTSPILVTGAHRSGTTWVGAMLALSPRIGLIHEPFSPVTPPGVAGGCFDRFFQYVCPENDEAYASHFERMLRFSYDLRRQLPAIRSPRALARTGVDFFDFTRNRLRGARPLLKDPIAVFSSEWLASRFGASVVVLIRHPAAFASSLVRLGWTHDFGGMLAQPLLMRDHLAPYESEIRRFAETEQDVLDQAILLWRVVYGTVATFRERHPDWTYVRHEDLSREPLPEFEALYATLGIPFDDQVRHAILEHSGEANPSELRRSHDIRLNSKASISSWRTRLTPEQIERVRTGTADVYPSFYGDDEDW
jgi:hypothetical protein